MNLVGVDVEELDYPPGPASWCGDCGHWIGLHAPSGCRELIPCAGYAHACTCRTFVPIEAMA